MHENNRIGASPSVDRPQRDIEGLIEHARTIDGRLNDVATRLQDMRRRLLGADEGKGISGKDSPVKEAVCSELHDLRLTLNRIGETVERVSSYVAHLESV